jgi:hypothetical protein
MYADADVPGGISPANPYNPFQTRVGICYKNKDTSAPSSASAFTVYKGSKSFAGPNLSSLAPLAPYYTQLMCNGLDDIMCGSTPLLLRDEMPLRALLFNVWQGERENQVDAGQFGREARRHVDVSERDLLLLRSELRFVVYQHGSGTAQRGRAV